MKPGTGMTTYSEGNNGLNTETIQLKYFKEAMSERIIIYKAPEWLKVNK